MKNKLWSVILMTMIFCMGNQLNAQIWNPIKGCVVDVNGKCVPNTILSAVPFLRIIPDARSGAMGDVGIATSVDPNTMHFNASKLAFVEQDLGFSASYTPWLRDLGLNDIYLTYLSGYKKIDKLQTLGYSIRFFSLGQIDFTDNEGNSQGTGKPREMEVALAYARKLGENFSAGLTGKYIYSNLASGQQVNAIDISSASAFAVDLSLTYKKDIQISSYDSDITFGLAATNIGNKISYTDAALNKDFLPMNLGLGTTVNMQFDEFNSMSFSLDLNKLLLPTPCFPLTVDDAGNIIDHECYDQNGNNIADYREKSMFSALLGSFGDAQGGFSEELQEISYSIGIEYWYDKQFAVRTGYYYENALKGDRKYFTIGVGLMYNVFGLNLSYLVPRGQRVNPLDNTLRFTLNFNFAEADK